MSIDLARPDSPLPHRGLDPETAASAFPPWHRLGSRPDGNDDADGNGPRAGFGDPDLLETPYKILYQQTAEGRTRLSLLPRSEIESVEAAGGVAAASADRYAEIVRRETYEAVVLATGYERSARHAFLEPVAPYVEEDAGRADRADDRRPCIRA